MIASQNVPIKLAVYPKLNPIFSFTTKLLIKLVNPFRTPNENTIEIEPKVNKEANLYGDMGSKGRKVNERKIKNTPMPKKMAKFLKLLTVEVSSWVWEENLLFSLFIKAIGKIDLDTSEGGVGEAVFEIFKGTLSEENFDKKDFIKVI